MPETAPAAPQVVLSAAGVRFGNLWALQDASLEISRGERVALVGPSGAGKTTLLSLIGGALHPSKGSATVFGQDLAELSPRSLARVQKRIGTIRQQFDLVEPLRVVHNVNAGRIARWPLLKALASLVVPQGVDEVRRMLDRVGLAAKIFERTGSLSGGEMQRVAIARVLAQDPDIILADEPIASLDPARASDTIQLLAGLAFEDKKTLVVSLHAFEMARVHCERLIGLRAGRVVFDLPAPEVTDDMAAALYRLEEPAL